MSVRSLESGDYPFANEGGLLAYMMADIDPTEAGFSLAGYLLMSGFLSVLSLARLVSLLLTVRSSAVTYSATFVWGGFMTGNWAQVRAITICGESCS